MDQNTNSFDALYNDAYEHRPLMRWDELLAFVRRFPQLAAFNAALIAQQRPTATFVETEDGWRERFGRSVEADATSMVILHPFGPVRFVYDIADTTGPELPTEVSTPFAAVGAPTWDGLHLVVATLRRKNLLPAHLPQTRSASVMLTRLLTELALVYSGHRGSRPELAVSAADPHVERSQVRFETECITWLIAGRIGLRAAATGSLKGYLKHGELMPPVSRDRVLHTVNAIERLFGGALAFGTAVRHEVPSLFELDEQLAV
ncbi:hypothetical protein [Brevibacterium sp. FAM 27836]|uniref:hypothetical protein n=1 Tax=Brevibacterium sp. FAM 27836 TaxID=3446693 RepID=UPI003F510AA1